MSKIVFLHSQSPRSGHNFMAEVIRLLIDCASPLGKTSEIPLAGTLDFINKTFKTHHPSAQADSYIRDLLLKDLRVSILENQTQNVLIKYTSFAGVEFLKEQFPNDYHLLLIRDPRDVLVSQFKAKRNNDLKHLTKRLLYPFGVYHFSYSRKYSKSILSALSNLNEMTFFTYEDLVEKDTSTLEKLIDLFGANLSVKALSEAMDAIEIINTSFYKEETLAEKLWESSPKTKQFKPIHRTKGFNKLQLFGIVLGSHEIRKKLGYI